MAKLIIFNFDGTSNEPEDAEQEFDHFGAVDDENITNILKFHLLCGGNLKTDAKPTKNAKQISLYYQGVGTYGNFFQRLYNSGLSKEKFDVAKILNAALDDFKIYYKKGDRVLVTGFSRGAALARRFASLINEKVSGQDIIEAVFDTVASIGLPNMRKSDRPKSEVVFEHGHTLPKNVLRALHCLSLDDKRKAFQPTLMNTEKKIHEVWFAGAHSDVGGGYHYDGLADVAFRYMLNWVSELSWDVKVMSPVELDYTSLVNDDAGYEITQDDVSIDPNVFGKNHQQERTPLIGHLTLSDRFCLVIENDEKTNIPPVVHHSVAQRIAGDSNYRPQSLKGIRHQLIYDDGALQNFRGMATHKEGLLNRLTLLQKNKPVTTIAYAHQKYNHSAIYVEENCQYKISVKKHGAKHQCWKDASIECNANGWDRDDVKLGLQEVAIAGMEPFRRVAKADWFCLCGTIGASDDSAFSIGLEQTVTMPKSGELCLFANDLNRFYGNNFGKLEVTIELVS